MDVYTTTHIVHSTKDFVCIFDWRNNAVQKVKRTTIYVLTIQLYTTIMVICIYHNQYSLTMNNTFIMHLDIHVEK